VNERFYRFFFSRLLALDGGGTRAVATTEILKEIEAATGKKVRAD
jgi:patatin-like phospholipase/acyl hydrolase